MGEESWELEWNSADSADIQASSPAETVRVQLAMHRMKMGNAVCPRLSPITQLSA